MDGIDGTKVGVDDKNAMNCTSVVLALGIEVGF